MIMKVLLAVDGSEAALRACRHLESLLHPGRDNVRIVTVLSYTFYPYSDVPGEPLVDEPQRERRVVEEVHRITDAPRSALLEHGISVEVAHRFGNVTESLIAEINEWRPDLVALGRRGVHGVERLLGSVSEHVLHHSTVPVLLVP